MSSSPGGGGETGRANILWRCAMIWETWIDARDVASPPRLEARVWAPPQVGSSWAILHTRSASDGSVCVWTKTVRKHTRLKRKKYGRCSRDRELRDTIGDGIEQCLEALHTWELYRLPSTHRNYPLRLCPVIKTLNLSQRWEIGLRERERERELHNRRTMFNTRDGAETTNDFRMTLHITIFF